LGTKDTQRFWNCQSSLLASFISIVGVKFVEKTLWGKGASKAIYDTICYNILDLAKVVQAKKKLRSMFCSEQFSRSYWAEEPNALRAKNIVLYDRAFWGCVMFYVITSALLICVL